MALFKFNGRRLTRFEGGVLKEYKRGDKIDLTPKEHSTFRYVVEPWTESAPPSVTPPSVVAYQPPKMDPVPVPAPPSIAVPPSTFRKTIDVDQLDDDGPSEDADGSEDGEPTSADDLPEL